MERTTILIFADSFQVGGSERQAVELIKGLDPARFRVLVACFKEEGPLSEEITGVAAEIVAFPLTSFYDANAVWKAVRFVRFLRRNKVQILQCFDFYSNVFAIPLARISGVPLIVASRRNQAALRSAAQKRVERHCFKFATAVVTNSARVKEQLAVDEGIPAKKVWVIPNGLDVERFDKLAQAPSDGPSKAGGDIAIAVVANLRPEKGHLVFLEAAHRTARRFPRATFFLAGDGTMRRQIEARIRELDLIDRVQMLGTVANVPAFLRDVDIVVSSSDTESSPNSVIEAMAASKPVVATDVGGTRELVEDGVTGLLVGRGDSATMADRIGRLCADPDMRRQMGVRGRQRIEERFTSQRMTRAFEGLYLRLTGERRRGARPQPVLASSSHADLATHAAKDS